MLFKIKAYKVSKMKLGRGFYHHLILHVHKYHLINKTKIKHDEHDQNINLMLIR